MRTVLIDQSLLEECGVVDWGYTETSKAASFSEFSNWIEKDYQGPLSYLSDHRKELRKDLKSFYPSFQSAIVFLFSYHQERNDVRNFLEKHPDYNQKKIASYALCFEGDDYHFELKKRLELLGEELKKNDQELEYALTLDVHTCFRARFSRKSGTWFLW